MMMMNILLSKEGHQMPVEHTSDRQARCVLSSPEESRVPNDTLLDGVRTMEPVAIILITIIGYWLFSSAMVIMCLSNVFVRFSK